MLFNKEISFNKNSVPPFFAVEASSTFVSVWANRKERKHFWPIGNFLSSQAAFSKRTGEN
jgi:hypothetical protein